MTGPDVNDHYRERPDECCRALLGEDYIILRYGPLEGTDREAAFRILRSAFNETIGQGGTRKAWLTVALERMDRMAGIQ